MKLAAALLAWTAGAASGMDPDNVTEVSQIVDQTAAIANIVIAVGMFAMLLKIKRYLGLPLGKTAERLKPVVRMFEPMVTVIALSGVASATAQLWPEYEFAAVAFRAATAVIIVWTIIDLRRNRARIETILKN